MGSRRVWGEEEKSTSGRQRGVGSPRTQDARWQASVFSRYLLLCTFWNLLSQLSCVLTSGRGRELVLGVGPVASCEYGHRAHPLMSHLISAHITEDGRSYWNPVLLALLLLKPENEGPVFQLLFPNFKPTVTEVQ